MVTTRKAQAVTELALFGSVLIVVMGYLVYWGMIVNHRQELQMKAHRLAFSKAAAAYDTSMSGSYTVLEDRGIANTSDAFGIGSRAPFMGSANLTVTNKMYYPMNNSTGTGPITLRADGTIDYSPQDMPRTFIKINAAGEREYVTSDLKALQVQADPKVAALIVTRKVSDLYDKYNIGGSLVPPGLPGDGIFYYNLEISRDLKNYIIPKDPIDLDGMAFGDKDKFQYVFDNNVEMDLDNDGKSETIIRFKKVEDPGFGGAVDPDAGYSPKEEDGYLQKIDWIIYKDDQEGDIDATLTQDEVDKFNEDKTADNKIFVHGIQPDGYNKDLADRADQNTYRIDEKVSYDATMVRNETLDKIRTDSTVIGNYGGGNTLQKKRLFVKQKKIAGEVARGLDGVAEQEVESIVESFPPLLETFYDTATQSYKTGPYINETTKQ